jgi:hypothetical protein
MTKHEGTVVVYGQEGCKSEFSTQRPFPKSTKCDHCAHSEALITITISEFGILGQKGQFACDLKPVGPDDGYWYHDAASWALYTCPHCFKVTVLWNQA